MDEVFVAVSGSRAVAEDMKSEIVTYLRKSLYLEVDDRLRLLPVDRKEYEGVTVLWCFHQGGNKRTPLN